MLLVCCAVIPIASHSRISAASQPRSRVATPSPTAWRTSKPFSVDPTNGSPVTWTMAGPLDTAGYSWMGVWKWGICLFPVRAWESMRFETTTGSCGGTLLSGSNFHGFLKAPKDGRQLQEPVFWWVDGWLPALFTSYFTTFDQTCWSAGSAGYFNPSVIPLMIFYDFLGSGWFHFHLPQVNCGIHRSRTSLKKEDPRRPKKFIEILDISWSFNEIHRNPPISMGEIHQFHGELPLFFLGKTPLGAAPSVGSTGPTGPQVPAPICCGVNRPPPWMQRSLQRHGARCGSEVLGVAQELVVTGTRLFNGIMMVNDG